MSVQSSLHNLTPGVLLSICASISQMARTGTTWPSGPTLAPHVNTARHTNNWITVPLFFSKFLWFKVHFSNEMDECPQVMQ